jgi:hypothetical protein
MMVHPNRTTRKSEPVLCIVGDTLCRVRVFSDAQWERIDPAKRPTTAEYFPGLGWVAAVGPNS